MSVVPEAYYEFVIHYAPYFYVVPTALASDASAGQKNVSVADGSKFQAGFPVEIKDDAHSEWNTVASIAGNVITMQNNLAYTYYVAKGGTVDHPDKDFGKGAFPAAFGIEFLCEAYSASQFSGVQAAILAKIVELADWLLTQQCTDVAEMAYGGFKSNELSSQYWSVDAGRCIPALLKAYALIGTAAYLSAAKLAGYTFLWNMQHEPAEEGLTDKYYGGFANYVTLAEGAEEQKFEYYNTGADCDIQAYGAMWRAQTYTPQKKHKITSVKIEMCKYGNPGTVTVSIRATSEGKPTGPDLCVGTTDGNTLPNCPIGTWRKITFTSQAAQEVGVQYAVIVRALNGDASNSVSIRNDNSSPTYPRGAHVVTYDSGETWSIGANRDLMFEEWGLAATFDTTMSIENLYCILGLKMLAETYDIANASRYVAMMTDLVGFLRDGFEQLYLYYKPPPSGSGVWYRVGLNDTEVYDDPVSFALLGLYMYEGWSSTCQRVYNFIQSIRASGQYPAYWPEICWPGYLDVVTRFPACAYYDAITTGILWKIRKECDPPSFKLAHGVVSKYSDEFLYWGPQFTDYSPITAQKAMANVSWLARMFLNYEEPVTRFTQILNSKGEAVLLYPIRQAVETVSYGEAFDLLAIVSPLRAEEVILELGYVLNDYVVFYTFVPVRVHDKIRRKGEDYELQSIQAFTFENQTIYFKSVARRLLAT